MTDKNGKPKRWHAGAWILESRVHGNSNLENRLKNILEQIRPKKTVLRRLLKRINPTLTIAVEPHRDLFVRSVILPAELLNEFTSLGVDMDISFHNPQNWAEFWQEIERRQKRTITKEKRVELQKTKVS